MSGDAEMESDGVLGLLVARALWMVRGDAAPTAIDAATRALVQGVDSAPVRELAGAAADMNVFELGALIDAALSSAGIVVSEMTEDQALQLSARHYVRCVLRGHMSARELAGWAHSSIGTRARTGLRNSSSSTMTMTPSTAAGVTSRIGRRRSNASSSLRRE